MFKYSIVYVVGDELGDKRFEERAVDVYLPGLMSEHCRLHRLNWTERIPLIPLPCNPREDSCLKFVNNKITEDALSEELKGEITEVPRVSI